MNGDNIYLETSAQLAYYREEASSRKVDPLFG